jgi:hypothetical protein
VILGIVTLRADLAKVLGDLVGTVHGRELTVGVDAADEFEAESERASVATQVIEDASHRVGDLDSVRTLAHDEESQVSSLLWAADPHISAFGISTVDTPIAVVVNRVVTDFGVRVPRAELEEIVLTELDQTALQSIEDLRLVDDALSKEHQWEPELPRRRLG